MRAKLGAEFIGTFWLVLGDAAAPCSPRRFPRLGIGLLGVSFAFGLTVLTGVYSVGPISGGHLNPAVSVGLLGWPISGIGPLAPYIIAQVARRDRGRCGAVYVSPAARPASTS